MRAYQASAMLWRHTWEEYETQGQVLGSPGEWGPEGLENRGTVWSPRGRCWLWVVWEVLSLKNTCCHLVLWNKLPCNYLGPEVHLQLRGIADSFSVCFLLIVLVWSFVSEDVMFLIEHIAVLALFTASILKSSSHIFIIVFYIYFFFLVMTYGEYLQFKKHSILHVRVYAGRQSLHNSAMQLAICLYSNSYILPLIDL